MPGLLFQTRIEIARVASHPERRVVVITGAGDQACGVPGGPRRELVLLDQEDVADAELGQVVGNGAADDAATDDDDACTGRQRR